MASVLRKLNLENYMEMFYAEKITPDIVGKLSLSDFRELGMQSRKGIMTLRLECVKYGSETPQRNRVECGAPQFDIPKSILECYLDQDFTINDISKLLSVSESTIYRRMCQFGLRKMDFSIITDQELDCQIYKITEEFPHCGEGLIEQILLGKRIKVRRWRLRESLHRVDS